MKLLTNEASVRIGLHKDLHVICEVDMELIGGAFRFCIFRINWISRSNMSIKLMQKSAIIRLVHRHARTTSVLHQDTECGAARSGPEWKERLVLGEIGTKMFQPTIRLLVSKSHAVPAGELHCRAD